MSTLTKGILGGVGTLLFPKGPKMPPPPPHPPDLGAALAANQQKQSATAGAFGGTYLGTSGNQPATAGTKQLTGQ